MVVVGAVTWLPCPLDYAIPIVVLLLLLGVGMCGFTQVLHRGAWSSEDIPVLHDLQS
jgi:hypothetical protein